MCGRRSCSVSNTRFRSLFGLSAQATPDLNVWTPKFNVAPQTFSPVLFANPPTAATTTTTTTTTTTPAPQTGTVTSSHSTPAPPGPVNSGRTSPTPQTSPEPQHPAQNDDTDKPSHQQPQIKHENDDDDDDDDNNNHKPQNIKLEEEDNAASNIKLEEEDCARYEDAVKLEPEDFPSCAPVANEINWEGVAKENAPEDEAACGPVKSVPTINMKMMRWGLVPSYSKTGTMPGSTINARSEGVMSSPLYSRLVPTRRCIVISDGYYEWRNETHHGETKKQPYFIYPPKGRLMLLAGLYDVWKDKDGKELYTYTILTTEPTKGIAFIHDRMPLVLSFEKAAIWLDVQNFGPKKDPEVFKTSLKPFQGELCFHRVSPAVGNVKAQGHELIKVYDPEKDAKVAGGMKVGAFHKFLKGGVASQKRPTSDDGQKGGDAKRKKVA